MTDELTLWCSQTSQDSKLLHSIDVAMPPTSRPANSRPKLLKCCSVKINQSISQWITALETQYHNCIPMSTLLNMQTVLNTQQSKSGMNSYTNLC